MARRCEHAHVTDCFLKKEKKNSEEAVAEKGQKKERKKEMIYAASPSVIPRNLVFHEGLKGGLRLKHMRQYGVRTCVSCRSDM